MDPTRKRRFSELMRIAGAARREEAEGFDAYWEAIGEILDDGLFAAGGYDGPKAFLAAEVRESARTVYRMIRVARFASPAQEKTYGPALLDVALSFVEAKAGGPIAGKLPIKLDALRIPVEGRKGRKTIPLEEATVAQVRSALRLVDRRAGKRRATAPPAEQALATAIGATEALSGVTVAVRSGKVWLGAIPLDQLRTLARVLGRVRLPTG